MHAGNRQLDSNRPPDIETSMDGYAARFAGPTGLWMLERQSEITLRIIKGLSPASVLDVGGGHGQLAGPLVAAGYDVTVLGSEVSCSRRLSDLFGRSCFRFVVGDLTQLPFPDQAFDVAVAFRLLCHHDRWPLLIRELCRVARLGVVIDYPDIQSLNVFSGWLFSLKKSREKNTRSYRLFSRRELDRVFAGCLFERGAAEKQFLLPMVLHRTINNVALSRRIEGAGKWLGLSYWFASPVIASWVRKHHNE